MTASSAGLTATLGRYFGFEAFRPGQAEAVESLLSGEHALVVMPTGAGKSLVYQLAALHLPGVTLVISPLIALMHDQVESLQRREIPATFLNSTLPLAEQRRRLQGMIEGAFRLVYISPERLRSRSFQEALRRVTVGLLAVDESHCISQWGHDFRPDYLYLAAARQWMGEPVTAALTATATPRVQDDIVERLGLASARRILTGFDRPNLFLEVRPTPDLVCKLGVLWELLEELSGAAAIVYTGTRRDAEEVAEFIAGVVKIPAQPYHAGLDAAARARVQDAFLGGELPVIVATEAFGMGVDRRDVRLVLHLAMPATLETYYQEAGRAGRDDEAARVVLLYDPQDRARAEWSIEHDIPGEWEARALYEALGAPAGAEVQRTLQSLSRDTGLREAQARLALAQLERAGAIERLGDDGRQMRLRVGEWDAAAALRVAEGVEEHRRHRRTQLAEMIAYAEADSCRRRLLLEYFGERPATPASPCCDNCLSPRPRRSPFQAPRAFEPSQAEGAVRVLLEAVAALDAETAARGWGSLLPGETAEATPAPAGDVHSPCGQLAAFSTPEMASLVAQTIRQGFLHAPGERHAAPSLTSRGEQVLGGRLPLLLHLPMRAEREAGGTVALTARMFAEGLTPAQIAFQRGLSESAVLGHLARRIGAGQLSLADVVDASVAARVEGAIVAVGDISSLSPLRARLPDAISDGEIRCVMEAWRRERGAAGLEAPAPSSGGATSGTIGSPARCRASVIEAFLARAHPRPLQGPWHTGWALDFNSRFAGDRWSRGRIGELTYRLKYRGDDSALPALVEHALSLCAQHPELADVDALVPVPPSTVRDLDPVSALADALGERLGRPVCPFLKKTRQTAPQKEMHSHAQKRANLAGALAVEGDVRGKRLLVLDDLYDSGATLAEAARVLRKAGVARVGVLTLTCTIHTDQ